MTPPKKKKPEPGKGTAHVRTRTPRPDELSRECFEFIAAVDDFKRKQMRSFLDDREVLGVAHDLGWSWPGGRATRAKDGIGKAELAAYAEAREAYRAEHGRLFPSWSEIFELLMGLGYEREDGEDGDEAAEGEAA